MGAALLSISPSHAFNGNFWDGSAGNWLTDANWSQGHAPVDGEDAIVRYDGAVTVDASVDATASTLDVTQGSSLTQTGGSVTLTGSYFRVSDEFGNGTFTMTGGTLDAPSAVISIGYSTGNGNGTIGHGEAEVSGDGVITNSNEFWIGQAVGSQGKLTVSGNAQILGATWFAVGRQGGTGELTVKGNATIDKSGGGNFKIAGDSGSVGTVTVEESGKIIVRNGPLELVGTNTVGTLTIKGSGSVDVVGHQVRMGGSGATGTLNLDGGRLSASWIEKTGGTVAVNFNGGTLVAQENGSSFLANFDDSDLHVLAGGLKFDTNGANVTITQGLTGEGGLSKLGDGTLTLAGANGYAGDTRVYDGTLTINTASLADGASVYIDDGAVLNLAFDLGTTDTVDQLFLNGVAAAVGTWGATGSGAEHIDDTFFAGSGTLTVVTAVPEPSTISLGMVGLLGLLLLARRRRVNA